MALTDEQPPIGTEGKLAEYLSRMFKDAKIADSQSDQLRVRYILPDKPQIGKIYYFGAAIGTTAITAEGYWGYKSTGWVQIA